MTMRYFLFALALAIATLLMRLARSLYDYDPTWKTWTAMGLGLVSLFLVAIQMARYGSVFA